MKSYIIGISLFILFAIFTIFQADYNKHQQQLYLLKYIAEEAAAAAAQFTVTEHYKEGYLVFNQQAGDLGARRILKENMSLDNSMLPSNNYYWIKQIDYTVHYFDDHNTDYPYYFNSQDFNFEIVVRAPTVIVIINAGQPEYNLIKPVRDVIASAAHEWQASYR